MSELIVLDMASSATVVIKHPIDMVWPHLLDQAAWMKDFRIETVSGKRNQVGELKKITPVVAGFRQFFFKTLRLVPLYKFVYKAYTDDRRGQYGFTGIEVLSIADFGSDSAVSFEAYLEIQSSVMAKQDLADFVSVQKQGSSALWTRNFQWLAELVDERSRLKHT